MKLAILGSFELRGLAGKVVDLPGQKDRALLAYLASPPGAARSREALAGILWGEHGEAQARDSLKHALTRIRQAVGQSALAADRQSVRLDALADSIDALSFERLARGSASSALADAVALYRGELLEGLNVRSAQFEDWLLPERRRLRHLFEATLERLIDLFRGEGALDAARDAASRLIACDPMNEVALRALMRHNSETGRVSHAIKLFEQHCDRLRVAPDDETVALAGAVRRRATVQKPTTTRSPEFVDAAGAPLSGRDRKSTRLNSSH